MAHVSQELKAKLSPAIKAHCKKFGVKASIAVDNHMTLVVNIKSGPFDFCQNFLEVNGPKRAFRNPEWEPLTKPSYIDVNTYWAHEQFSFGCADFLVELIRLMNIGNYDKSDIQTDYFCVGWYVNVNIGKWNQPYVVVK